MSIRGDIRKRVIEEHEEQIRQGMRTELPNEMWIESYVKHLSETAYRQKKEGRWRQ